jgi:4-amino-4-deoxy-L-arabinose transferase-like glycosyltransferase
MLSVAPIGTPETAPALETTGRRSPLQVSAETLFPAVLAAAAFVVRLWPVWQVHFWDECVYLQNAEVLCCGKTNYSELSSRPPLLSLLFAVVFRVWHSAFAASLLTAALNALGPLFLFLSGRKLVSRTAAGIAALLLAFGPFFVNGNTGNSLLTDSPALTLILLSCWLTLEAAERNSAWWTGFAGFVGALAVLMRFASVPAIGMVSLLLLRRGRWLRAVVRFGIGFGVAIVPYLLWSKIGYGGFLTTLQRGWANVAGSSEPPAYYIQHFVEVFSWIAVAGLVLWFVRAVLDARAGQKPTWRDAFLWAWAVAMLAYFSSITHKELRATPISSSGRSASRCWWSRSATALLPISSDSAAPLLRHSSPRRRTSPIS